MHPIILVLLILRQGVSALVNWQDSECCPMKTVGGLHYTLVEETDTSPYHCLANCVYQKRDSPGSKFCFKTGELPFSCTEGDMAEKMEAVHKMKEEREKLDEETLAIAKEQSASAPNRTNKEELMLVMEEVETHMEEMKGFMKLDTFIKGSDMDSVISTTPTKPTSTPKQSTDTDMTEEEVEEHITHMKVEMADMENAMANKNYTGDCCRLRVVEGQNYTLLTEEENAVSAGCSSNCVYTMRGDFTRKFCDLEGECNDDAPSVTTPPPDTASLLPVFEWVDSSTVMVTYQSSLDVIHLTPMESSIEDVDETKEDLCLFDGALEVETSGFVIFTGCYSTSEEAVWEILLISSSTPRDRQHYLWWANGTVTEPVMLPSNCDTPEDCEQEYVPPQEGGESQDTPLSDDDPIPTLIELEFELMYDNSMVEQYGHQEAAFVTNRIAHRGCALLRSRSITPRVICKHNYPTHYDKDADGTNLFDDGYSHFTLTSTDKPRHIVTANNQDNIMGKAQFKIGCPTQEGDIAVTEQWGTGRDVTQAAVSFARQMGHWLGMKDDYEHEETDDFSCNGEGIMSYGNNRTIDWSFCNNEDLGETYRSTYQCRKDLTSGYKRSSGGGSRRDYRSSIRPQRTTSWGNWGRIEWCPTDSWVHYTSAIIEGRQGSGRLDDDTALNGFNMYCGWRGSNFITKIQSSKMGFGFTRSGGFRGDGCSSGHYIKGFQLRSERNKGGGDDTSVNGFDAWCTGGSRRSLLGSHNDGYWGEWKSQKHCPSNTAICGIQTLVEGPQWLGDDTALNGVKFFCCSLP